MTAFEQGPRLLADVPDVQQLLEYRELLTQILITQGRVIRFARAGERARTQQGTEYFLPGAATEVSIPDSKFRTHTTRERRYSASFREMGTHAARLLVLESDSVLLDQAMYDTRRNIYRFSCDADGVYESEVMPIQIISSATVDAEVLEVEPFGIKEFLSCDQEHTATATAENGGRYHRYINPFRSTESPWEIVGQSDFDGLLRRTQEYGRALL